MNLENTSPSASDDNTTMVKTYLARVSSEGPSTERDVTVSAVPSLQNREHHRPNNEGQTTSNAPPGKLAREKHISLPPRTDQITEQRVILAVSRGAAEDLCDRVATIAGEGDTLGARPGC